MRVPPIPYAEGTVQLADGRLLGYAAFGDPDGNAVLWAPGTPGGRKQLPPETPEEAAARGLRVICIERPGTGISTNYLYEAIADYATDAANVADVLGIDRFGVAGLSGGGPYTLACAAILPERVVGAAVLGGLGPTRGPEACSGYPRVLVPLSPVLQRTQGPLAFAVNALLPIATVAGDPLYATYSKIAPKYDRPLLRQPAFKEMFLQDLFASLDHGIRAPIYDLVLFSKDWGFSLRDIRVPVRFWHGDSDRIVPFSHGVRQSELVADSHLTVVPHGGHFSGFETVPLVLDVFQGWFEPDGELADAIT